MNKSNGGSENDRKTQLTSIGLSPALQDLATGKWPLPLFEFPCGPVFKCYSIPQEQWPTGFLPLWECGEVIVGVRQKSGGLEFMSWNVESHGVQSLARTEQGLLYWLFSYLVEYEDWATALEGWDAAAAVEFRHLDRLWSFMQLHERRADYRELVRAEALRIGDG